ncbi:hypothetical protein GCM10010329_80920 [Streptomyces spiroverticillatus]|uniref:Uncharacterized protein n=1 Tax=Streptomyces finlayi TaxID=67296 RepID=A0A918X7M0_9ACTN|nr:hypothetical protein GCM10010329_80920 [Streptomyces spiroverticillatus]GHD16115.1 hypothetical protein GCM10010334_76840 [Streptomyces finlayi]
MSSGGASGMSLMMPCCCPHPIVSPPLKGVLTTRQLASTSRCAEGVQRGRVAAIKNQKVRYPRRLGSAEGLENLVRRLSVFHGTTLPVGLPRHTDPRRLVIVAMDASGAFSFSGYPGQPSGEGVEVT